MHGKELKIVLSKLEKEHLKGQVENSVEWECKKCTFTTGSEANLIQHVQVIHEKMKKSQVLKNMKKSQVMMYKCKQCTFTSIYGRSLKNHIDAIHMGKKFICKMCNYETGWESNLKTHIKSKHKIEEVNRKAEKELKVVINKLEELSCNLCNYSTFLKHDLAQHIVTAHNSNGITITKKPREPTNFECSLCDYQTPAGSRLSRHVNAVHLQIRDFSCPQCQYQSSYKVGLQKHIKTKHNEVSMAKESEKELKPVLERLKLWPCNQCHYTTVVKEELMDHEEVKHNISNKMAQELTTDAKVQSNEDTEKMQNEADEEDNQLIDLLEPQVEIAVGEAASLETELQSNSKASKMTTQAEAMKLENQDNEMKGAEEPALGVHIAKEDTRLEKPEKLESQEAAINKEMQAIEDKAMEKAEDRIKNAAAAESAKKEELKRIKNARREAFSILKAAKQASKLESQAQAKDEAKQLIRKDHIANLEQERREAGSEKKLPSINAFFEQIKKAEDHSKSPSINAFFKQIKKTDDKTRQEQAMEERVYMQQAVEGTIFDRGEKANREATEIARKEGKYVHEPAGRNDSAAGGDCEVTVTQELTRPKLAAKPLTHKITWPRYEAQMQGKKQEQSKDGKAGQKVEKVTRLESDDQNMRCTEDVAIQEAKLLRKDDATLEADAKRVIENAMMEELSRLGKEQEDLWKVTDIARLETETEKSHGKEKRAIIKMKKFACKYCHYRSSFRHGLQQHLKSTHNKAYHFECSLCDYWTHRRIDLSMHKKANHKALRSCRYCDYDATSQEMLIEHIMTNVLTHVASNNVD